MGMYEPKSNPNYPNHQVARRFVPNAPYRVAHDLHGDWWIWRRSNGNTWTTYQRCTSETQAQILCDELISQNETPLARK
tara:strand:- start:323 stop:559 length:237 start_codon:yes stop_codon:yes gene_type:complete